MKKISCLLIGAVLALALTACTSGTTTPEEPANTTAPTESTATTTEPTTAPTTGASAEMEEAEALAVANDLFEKLHLIDCLGACAVATDPEDTFQDGDYLYSRVTDSRFPTLEALNNFLQNTLTENLLGTRYSGMVNGERVTYVDHDGALYAMQAGRGCGFDYLEEATVSELTPTSFHAKRKYDNFGGESYLEIDAVLEDGLWKIDKMTMDN